MDYTVPGIRIVVTQYFYFVGLSQYINKRLVHSATIYYRQITVQVPCNGVHNIHYQSCHSTSGFAFS